jgi:cyclic-di-AMP phosphodiesterase PgpH
MSKKEKIGRFSFKSFSKGQLSTFWILMLLCLAVGTAVPILLSSNILFAIKPSRTYSANELSDEDLISPISFSYIDEEQTKKKREEAGELVVPYFTYSYSASLTMTEKADVVYDYLVSGTFLSDESLSSVSSLLTELDDTESYSTYGAIIRETVDHFVKEGIFSSDDISYVIEQKKDSLFVNNSEELPYSLSGRSMDVDEVITDISARSAVYQYLVVSYPDTDSVALRVIADIIQEIIEANVFYDEIYTKSLKDQTMNQVEPVVVDIEKGDYILNTDTLVTSEALYTLEVLNSKRVINMDVYSVLPRFLLVVFILIVWFCYSIGLIQYEYRKAQYTLIMLSSFLLDLIVGFVIAWKIVDMGYSRYDALMPFLITGMLGVAITNSVKYGVSSLLALSALYTLWPNASFYSLIYYVVCGAIVCMLVRGSKGRYDTISTCLKSSGILFLLTFLFVLLETTSLYDVLFSCAGIIFNVIFAFIMYAIVLPILEKIFNIPTKQRLIELAYTDNATLNQLSQIAQGTYNHVKNVADLAYAAALAIGCNAELTLVGARYHDIGKMVHPEYFVENQSDKNAHDQISSQLSKSIIKSHVRLGTEKGKEIGLPQEVLDIISQHHGNDLIRYFYNEAVRSMGEQNVAKEDFMYDGVPPTTKESAIVMISDCVEAATRTIKRPNHQKYERMINTLVNERISFGQLDNSGLTMNEIKAIKEAFIPILIGRDHHRISYENDKD